MKLFRCDNCHQTLYFENVACERCGYQQGYLAEANALAALEPDGETFMPLRDRRARYVFCANAQHGACNWLVPYQPGGDPFCYACRHNDTIPPLDSPSHLGQFQTLERAKKRLFYSLMQFGLPVPTRGGDGQGGLSFRFLADDAPGAVPVMTGHDNGIITIALAEADDAERERRRTSMHEPYRTLLGHFRHETGHYYWDRLVAGGPSLGPFRGLFGDEREDYGQALQRHYEQGPPAGWQGRYVSAYASSHPWEDFAETWAHLLHVTDTMETAAAFGVRVAPVTDETGQLTVAMLGNPYAEADVGRLVGAWVPLALLLNNLNRAVGQADAYPFVLTAAIVEKLQFIGQLIEQSRHSAGAGQ